MTICVDRLYASIEQPVLITRCVFHTLLQLFLRFVFLFWFAGPVFPTRQGRFMGQLMLAWLSRSLRTLLSVKRRPPKRRWFHVTTMVSYSVFDRSGVRVSSERIVREVPEDRRITSVIQ